MLMRQCGPDGDSLCSSQTFQLRDLAYNNVGREYINADSSQLGESTRE